MTQSRLPMLPMSTPTHLHPAIRANPHGSNTAHTDVRQAASRPACELRSASARCMIHHTYPRHLGLHGPRFDRVVTTVNHNVHNPRSLQFPNAD